MSNIVLLTRKGKSNKDLFNLDHVVKIVSNGKYSSLIDIHGEETMIRESPEDIYKMLAG